MTESVQNIVNSFSQRIFPGINTNQKLIDDNNTITIISSPAAFVYNVNSSLILQMALYFNVTYFPIWLVINIISLIVQYSCFNWFAYLMLGFGLTALVTVESTRLYLGFSGNLGERIDELSTFWFATLLIQVPLTCIHLLTALITGQILQTANMSISIIFTSIQLCVSFTTLSQVARRQ